MGGGIALCAGQPCSPGEQQRQEGDEEATAVMAAPRWAIRLCAGGSCGKWWWKHSHEKQLEPRAAEILLLVADIFCWSFLFGESES